MAEVELILKADNSQYVNKVKDAQKATQELHNTASKGAQREKGILEEIDATLTKLEKARRKAFSYEDIEKYNKKIAETKQYLKEYEEAGMKTAKTTETMTQSFIKWIAQLGIAVTIMNALKKAFLETQQGILLFNTAAAATKQILYNIVNGVQNWNTGVAESIVLAKKMNDLRIKDRFELLEAKKLMQEYNELYTEGVDASISHEDKIKKLTEAKVKYQKAIDVEINSTREQLRLAKQAFDFAPSNDKNQLAVIELMGKMTDLRAQRVGGIRRLERQITGEQERQNELQIEALQKIKELGIKLGDAFVKDQEAADKEYLDNKKKFYGDYWDWFRTNLAKLPTTAELERKQALETIEIATDVSDYLEKLDEYYFKGKEDKIKEQKEWWADYEDWFMDNVNKINPEPTPKEILEGLQKAFSETTQVISDIIDQSVTDAQRRRELLDTQIAETQRGLELETELYKQGYASNVAAKQKELEQLEKQRAVALRKEEEAIKRQKQLDTITQVSALVTASAQTFKAFPGPLLPVAIAVVAAMFAAFAASKIKANSETKLAEGGSGTVRGKRHSQGGERFLDHVEIEQGEHWGVLSRRAASKYGDVFHDMVSSFNKDQMPEFITPAFSNNIRVDNNGPNKRLDKIYSELEKQNRGREEVMLMGDQYIIRKGNNVRIIKR